MGLLRTRKSPTSSRPNNGHMTGLTSSTGTTTSRTGTSGDSRRNSSKELKCSNFWPAFDALMPFGEDEFAVSKRGLAYCQVHGDAKGVLTPEAIARELRRICSKG